MNATNEQKYSKETHVGLFLTGIAIGLTIATIFFGIILVLGMK